MWIPHAYIPTPDTVSLELECRGGGGELAATDGHGLRMAVVWGRGGNTTGSSACTTVVMKHPGAVSEFEAALLDLSHRTQKASVATCTCYLLVTRGLSRCLQRWSARSGLYGPLWKGSPGSCVPHGLKTTSTPSVTQWRDGICRILIFQWKSNF